VPVPAAVAHGTVRLSNPARYDVPVTLICPEFGPDDARAWIAGGDVPELAKATALQLVDLDSGHWPMFTQPAALARLIADAS
jgi:pimeloyl-ACP methyl ester carboxylesterase